MSVIDPGAPLRVVRANNEFPDPAIDWEKTPREQYRKTRDEDLLVIKEGMTPVWFHIRRLDGALMIEALDTLEGAPRIAMAFRAALFAVQTGPEEKDRLVPQGTSPTAYGASVADSSWITTVRNKFGMPTVEEMGLIAYKHGRLPEGVKGPYA